MALRGGIPQKGILEVAPELIVEVVSDTETQRDVEDKIAGYRSIGVKEVWLVRPILRTVELQQLTPDGFVPVAVYGETQTLPSIAFPGLTLAISDFFKS